MFFFFPCRVFCLSTPFVLLSVSDFVGFPQMAGDPWLSAQSRLRAELDQNVGSVLGM